MHPRSPPPGGFGLCARSPGRPWRERARKTKPTVEKFFQRPGLNRRRGRRNGRGGGCRRRRHCRHRRWDCTSPPPTPPPPLPTKAPRARAAPATVARRRRHPRNRASNSELKYRAFARSLRAVVMVCNRPVTRRCHIARATAPPCDRRSPPPPPCAAPPWPRPSLCLVGFVPVIARAQ